MEIIEEMRDVPDLCADTIHVWGVHVPGILNRLDALRAVLCEQEREKASRFHREADRQASIASRGALRILISGYTGRPASEIQFTYSETGKPGLACGSVSFNVSHSGDWAVLAFGRDRHVGVDVEMIKWDMDIMSIASRYFTPEETALIKHADDKHVAFFQLWARKEAYVKAAGSGLFRELSSFSVPGEDGERDGWYFHRLEAGSKYAAAVVTDKPLDNIPCYDFGGLKWEN